MAEHALSSLAMRTEFFTAEHMEAAARRTGFVKRASNLHSAPFPGILKQFCQSLLKRGDGKVSTDDFIRQNLLFL